MRAIVRVSCTALTLALTGPAGAHSGGPVLDPALPGLAPVTVLALTQPACRSEVFRIGETPADPATIDSITCLDAACHNREITLCDGARR